MFVGKRAEDRGRIWRKKYEDYTELAFSVEEVSGGILVTFKQLDGASGGVNEVLNYIRLHPGEKTADMLTALDISQKTLERWIKQLRDEKKIVFRGVPKTDGYYVGDVD